MKILIASATAGDSKDIWQWRNDPATISNSNSAKAVSWQDHQSWFERMLKSAESEILLGVTLGDKGVLHKIGMVRFDLDIEKQHLVCSINLNPIWRGKGLATPLLKVAIENRTLATDLPIYAEVKPENIASIKCFEKNKFKFTKNKNGVNQYLLNLHD